MKAYHEYLELHSYFAVPGQPKLSRVDFDALAAEYVVLAAKHPQLSPTERDRLTEIKTALFRDKP